MRILNLILYNDAPQYNRMRDELRRYLRTIPNFQYYFYCFDSRLSKPYQITGDIIRFKGVESYIPGILDKTIRAFQLARKLEFDYLVRSNISSVINFAALRSFLRRKPIFYGGWIRTTSGAHIKHVSGTCIILSRAGLKWVVRNRRSLDRRQVDDMALAALAKQFRVRLSSIGRKVVTVNGRYSSGRIIYRNRSHSRYMDSRRMRQQVSALLQRREKGHSTPATTPVHHRSRLTRIIRRTKG